jgi:hypothetical protein
MSTDPTGVNGSTGERIRVNVYFKREDYCRYDGDCKIRYTLIDNDLCWNCIYMDRFDVPKLIEKALEEKENDLLHKSNRQ